MRRAIEIFERSVALHPSSADARDGLAGALEAAGRFAEALEHREEAVRRAAAIAHPELEAFMGRRDALRRRLNGGS